MEKSIWKFPFTASDEIDLYIPKGGEVLTVQIQGATPCMWVLVNPKAEIEIRTFSIVGTGHPIKYNLGKYIGTFQLLGGSLVFHIFETK